MVLNNLFSPLYCWLPGFARRVFCPLYLRDAAVYERKQQALQVKMTGNRVKKQIAPSSQAWSFVSRGAHSKCHRSSEGTAVEHGSLEALLPPCFAHAAEKAMVCCSFLLGASCNISSPRAGWVGAPQLSVPSASTRLCCSSRAGAAAACAITPLCPPCLRAWADHKVCSCVPHVKTHQLTVLAYLMQLRMAYFMPLLTWSCCKHNLPLHVDESDLFGAGFHCVFGSWCCPRGKPKRVPSFIHLCTLGSETPLLCSVSCCPGRTAAKLIHRDLSHTSVYLLGVALGPCSYLSKSVKSTCDCTCDPG